jgi:general secretion pathway protein M
MITSHRIDRYLARYPSLAGWLYGALIVILGLVALISLVDLGERYRVRNASFELLAQLKTHARISPHKPASANFTLPASAFLEGQTSTLASAALLQRVTGAITRAGGEVVSSEIASQGKDAKDGYVRAIATCELEQRALQQFLYDLEAGMPFLIIDQLLVHSAEGDRLRLVLTVTGLWAGAER